MELTAEFALVKRHYGDEIATKVFHVALEMCILPSEVRGAARHLNNGAALNDIIDLALTGKCKRTQSEYRESQQAIKELSKGTPADRKPSIADQLAEGRKAVAGLNAAKGTETPARADRKQRNEAR